MIGREQLRGEEVVQDGCEYERLWDWRQGSEVVVYLLAFRQWTKQVVSQARLEMDELVFGAEANELHSAQLEQYREMESVAELLLDSEAFRRRIQNRDWVSAQQCSLGLRDL